VCNECGAVLRTVPAAELPKVLHQMELALPAASALCPHCGSVNLFPGFEEIFAFSCKECGRFVEPLDSASYLSCLRLSCERFAGLNSLTAD
jgi:uncharacterized protein (DUF983 family)